MKNPLLQVKNLSFGYDNNFVLQNINFDICGGEYISIVGANGSGKSTFLKCIMRILQPCAGLVSFNGLLIDNFSQKQLARQIAYVPQSSGRFSPFLVYEHVMLARYPYLSAFSKPRKEDNDIVEKALEETSLSEFAMRKVSSLSGGERQKVYLARALAQNARLLLLDEPATFLDPRSSAEISKLLKKINVQHQVAIVCVTHDINAAALYSDKIMAFKKGISVFFEKADSFINEETLQMIFDTTFSFVQHPDSQQRLIFQEHS